MKNIFHPIILLVSFLLGQVSESQLMAQVKADTEKPVRIGVARLTHTHVHGLLGRNERGDIKIVGIYEPNRELAERFTREHGISMAIVFNSMEEMITKTKPEVITAF